MKPRNCVAVVLFAGSLQVGSAQGLILPMTTCDAALKTTIHVADPEPQENGTEAFTYGADNHTFVTSVSNVLTFHVPLLFIPDPLNPNAVIKLGVFDAGCHPIEGVAYALRYYPHPDPPGENILTFDTGTGNTTFNNSSPALGSPNGVPRYVWIEAWNGETDSTKLATYSYLVDVQNPQNPSLPITCTPPHSLFVDNTGGVGLAEGFALNQHLDVGGSLAAQFVTENNLHFWLGVQNIVLQPIPSSNPFPQFTADTSAGTAGQMAGLGLIPACRSGFAVQCVNPGRAAWKTSFCAPGNIRLNLALTPLSASMTLIDTFVAGSPPSTLVALTSQLEATVPSFKAARDCLLKSGLQGFACALKNLRQFAHDPAQVNQFQAVFKQFGISVSTQSIISDLLSVGTIQRIGDLIVFEIQTQLSGKLAIMINGN